MTIQAKHIKIFKMRKTFFKFFILGFCLLPGNTLLWGQGGNSFPTGTGLVNCSGYTGCIKLENDSVRVVLDPNCGGRVLEYSWKGRNIIALNPEQDGWVYTKESPEIDPFGGRFDIGPELIIPKHPVLWVGRWQGKITGPRTARLTSQPDEATGAQLTRDFELVRNHSRLRITQTIKNISGEKKEWCSWGRTLVLGGGICLVPLNPKSRFPKGYVIYEPGYRINLKPGNHPNVRIRDGILEILGVPEQPKFGIDSNAGWLAYLTPDNLLFLKRFPVYPDRVYSEPAANTVSIFYVSDRAELEPIGPREKILPGKSVSYTEEWHLRPFPFPAAGKEPDLDAIRKIVSELN